jgi:hypothetical protein
VQFLAKLYDKAFRRLGFDLKITFEPPEDYSVYELCFVFGAVAFVGSELPPAEKRVIMQLEQKSSPWMSPNYFKILSDSRAVIEYSLDNIQFFETQSLTRELNKKL